MVTELFKPELEWKLRQKLIQEDNEAYKKALKEHKTEAERKRYVAAMKLQAYLEKQFKE